jgi:hypothetical protein
MNADLDAAGEPDVCSDRTCGTKAELLKGIQLQEARQQVLEHYRSQARQEFAAAYSTLATMTLTPDLLRGMTNVIEHYRNLADEAITQQLQEEAGMQRFLGFMLARFDTYYLQDGTVHFVSRHDRERYLEMTSVIKARQAVRESELRTTDHAGEQKAAQ